MTLPRSTPILTPADPLSAEAAADAPAQAAMAQPAPWHPAMLLMPLTIGTVLSGLMTWLNVGFASDFGWRWLTSFVSALPVMALGFALMSFYGRLFERLMPAASGTLRKIALALAMALTLELLMSSVVTLRNFGWAEGFTAAWATAFWRSLPIGVLMGLLMGFVVRPRVQRMLAGRAGA